MKIKMFSLLLRAVLLSTTILPMTSSIGLAYAQSIEDLLSVAKDVKEEGNKSDDKDDTKGNKAYSKVITKDAKTARGFIDVHLIKDKVYLEIPIEVFNKPMLFSGRVTKISNNKDVIAGQMPASPVMVGWSRDETRVFLHELSSKISADPNASIYNRVMDNAMEPVLNAFKIETWRPDSSAVVINATNLFLTSEAPITPFVPATPFDALFGMKKMSGTFKKDLSSITNIASYPTNLNVEVRTVYTVDKAPFTAVINASLLLLPDDVMRPRIADERIGYFTDFTTKITTDKMMMDRERYVNRFRLEPKPEDVKKMREGKLVEPKKPIIYYIDDAFPEEWWPYLKEGVEDWQEAFEKAGFKNAIIAKKYPKDPHFNPYDARYNCIIYSSSQTANAMGPSWTDPRSGEILQGSVYFYHNVLELLHSWRFVQTSAADPNARGLNYDLAVLGPMLRYLVAHEVGHTIGLMHNMGASSTYSVAQLRDPAFTSKWGTTPSIMDYARYNYIAQPNDKVKDFLPPRLGIYDIYAIQWGYTPIFDAKNPHEETSTLNKWISEKAGDPRFAYGPQQLLQIDDPYSQTEDLGDDAVLASKMGINNLKITTDNLFKWTEQKGKVYKTQLNLLNDINSQFKRYMGHCMALIGGGRNNLAVQGDGKPAVTPVPKAKQREALFFVLSQTIEQPNWIVTPEVRSKLGLSENNFSDYMLSVMNILLSNGTLGKISKMSLVVGPDAYTPQQYMDDLHRFVWEKTDRLSAAEKNMQYAYVANLISTLDLNADEKKRSKISSAKIESKGILFGKLMETKKICTQRNSGENMGHYANLVFLIDEALKN